MLKISIERIGDVAVIHCKGRVVQSAAAFRLRDAVARQANARVILVDLSEIQSVEGGGLGMLVFLQRWAREHGIQFKVFDLPASVRQRLEQVGWASELEIAGTSEVLSPARLGAKGVVGGSAKTEVTLSDAADTA